MGEENNFYLAPWVQKYKQGRKTDLLQFLKKGNTIEERYIDDMAKRFAYGNSKPYYEKDIASGLDEKTALKYAKEYMERYGDDEYAVFDFGTLPEVTIRPSKADKKSLAKLKRILPDKASRMDMYKIIDMYKMIDENINNNNPLVSQNESIDRLYEVYRKAKYPKISFDRTIFNYLGSLYNKSKNWSRAMYSPLVILSIYQTQRKLNTMCQDLFQNQPMLINIMQMINQYQKIT